MDFPGEEGPADDNPIAEGLNRLVRKADDYAAHMFEEEGKEHEAGPPGRSLHPRHRRGGARPPAGAPPRRQPPPAPDLPAGDLARRYGKGLKSLGVRARWPCCSSCPPST